MSERSKSPKLTSRFEEALTYAARAHWDHIRKVTPREAGFNRAPWQSGQGSSTRPSTSAPQRISS